MWNLQNTNLMILITKTPPGNLITAYQQQKNLKKKKKEREKRKRKKKIKQFKAFLPALTRNKLLTSHRNYWDQVNSWKKIWKFWNGPLCRRKSGLFSLRNVVTYWKSSNSEACSKKRSQLIASKIDNGGGGLVSKFTWSIAEKIMILRICGLVKERFFVKI